MNSEYEQYKMDGLHEECGVFGMYDLDGGDVASSSRGKQQSKCAAACAQLCQRYTYACSQWKPGQCA